MKPIFVVLEGLDGSGTSTQARLLASYFQKLSTPVEITAEPSTGLIGATIRLALKRRVKFQDDRTLFDRQMALMFAADRHDHLYNDAEGVAPTLIKGTTVICTRYIPSSFAYHCSNESEWEFISKLNSEFPLPDLLIYLDNHVESSLNRISNRNILDTYEQEDKLRQAEVNYKRYLSEYRGKSITINANLPKEEVFSNIIESIKSLNNPKEYIMNTLNNDDPESQELLAWFSKSDERKIKIALTEIAESESEVEKFAQERFTISQYQTLCSVSSHAPKLVVLIEIIQSLIDPFISQAPIGQALKQKGCAILQTAGINPSTYPSRLIEIDSAVFHKIFRSILLAK